MEDYDKIRLYQLILSMYDSYRFQIKSFSLKISEDPTNFKLLRSYADLLAAFEQYEHLVASFIQFL